MIDKICIWVAWLLPKRLVYWCAMRVYAHASTGEYRAHVVPALTAFEASERWERKFSNAS